MVGGAVLWYFTLPTHTFLKIKDAIAANMYSVQDVYVH